MSRSNDGRIVAVRAVVPAAGSSSRYGRDKLYEPLAGKTVIGHALSLLLAEPGIEQIAVAIAENDKSWHKTPYADNDKITTAKGGASRAQSVLNGLNSMQADAADWVLVHDAARPCLHRQDLDKLLAVTNSGACGAILAAPVYDTIKHGENHKISKTVDRSKLWRALTPQLFRHAELKQALTQAVAAASNPSDEAHAMELAGAQPELVPGRSDNIKITCPQDLVMAEAILALQ